MPISFADRILDYNIHNVLLKNDPQIKRCLTAKDAETIEGYGVRYLSLTLARLMEIYDGLLIRNTIKAVLK